MGGDMNVSVIMSLVDRFSNRSRKINQSFDRMGKTGQRAMRGINTAAAHASNGLDRFGNRYTAFLSGAAGAGAGNSVVRMQRRLKTLGIQASMTKEELDGLKDAVFNTARMSDVQLDPNQILDAVDKIVEKTGDLDLARRNLRNIGLAIRASNSAGGDIGAMVADLAQKFDIKTDAELFQTLDLLINQGKAGAFTLQNLATQGERVTAAYAAMGRTGVPAVREMGAMLQMIKQGTGSPEQAATAFEALLRTLNDAQKRKLLTKAGISLIDPDDPQRMRAIDDIVKDIIKATGGDLAKLSTIFDAEAIRALNAVAIQYKQTGSFADLDKFLNQTSDGAQLMRDAAEATDEFDSALQSLKTAGAQYTFNKLNGPIKDMAKAINNLDPDKLEQVIDLLAKGGLLLGGAVVANKVARGGIGLARSVKGMMGAGAVVASKAAPQPVIVLNWPRSFGMGAGQLSHGFGKAGAAGAAGAAGSRASRLVRFGRFARARALPLAMAANSLALVGGMATGNQEMEKAAAGRFAGGFTGAAAGAVVGSVVPIVGTAVGAAIGGVLGSLGGGKLGEIVGRRSDERAALDAGGTVHIKIDNEGQARVADARSNDKRIDYRVDTGLLMGGL